MTKEQDKAFREIINNLVYILAECEQDEELEQAFANISKKGLYPFEMCLEELTHQFTNMYYNLQD